MAYNKPIHFDIPDEESKPIVRYVENTYQFLDFYECSNPTYDYGQSKPDRHIKSPSFQIDTLIRGSTISEDGTFTKNMKYNQLQALTEMSKESGGVSVGYDTNNPKSTEFSKTDWDVDLSTSFHNNLQISGFLGVSTGTVFTTIGDDQDISVEGINLRKEFFNYRLGILKAYNPVIKNLIRLSGNTEYVNFDQQYLLRLAQQIVGQSRNQKPVYQLLSKEEIPRQTNQLEEFGRENDNIYDRNISINFKGLNNKVVRCTVVLNDGSTVDGLVKDFYVAVHPVKSKMMSLQTFIEKYGIFADLTKPLVKTKPDPTFYRTRNGERYPPLFEYNTSDTEHNLTYNQSVNKRGAFLGLSNSLTDKKNLFITVPNSSSGLYNRQLIPRNTRDDYVDSGHAFRSKYDNRLRAQVSGGEALFDFLRHAIYSSRNYYDNGLYPLGLHSLAITSVGDAFNYLKDSQKEELQTFGFLNPANYNRSTGIYDLPSPKFRGDLQYYPYPSYWSKNIQENIYNHTPSPKDSIFVHLYDLEVSLYPRTINTQNSIKPTDIKEIQYQTTDHALTADIQYTNGSRDDTALFNWSLSSYKNSTTKNFYMYNVQSGKTFSTIASGRSRLYNWPSEQIRYHKAVAFERNENPSFDEKIKTLQFRPTESGQTFRETNQLLEDPANLDKETLPSIVFPTADATVEAAAINPPNPEPINISHEIDLQNQKILVTWDNGLSGSSEEYSAISLDSNNSQPTTHVLSIYRFILTIKKLDPATNRFVVQSTMQYGPNSNQHTINIGADINNFLLQGQQGNIDYEISITAQYRDTLRGTIVTDPVKTVADVDPAIVSILPQLKPVKPQLSVRRTGVGYVSLKFVSDAPQGPYESLIERLKNIEVEYYASNDSFDKKTLTIPWSRQASSGEFRIDNLKNSTNYTISIKITNHYGISESSDTIVATTKEPTGISNLKLSSVSVSESKFTVRVDQIGKSNNTRNLTGINFTYQRAGENIVFPVDVGSVKLASFEPVQRLIDGSYGENVIFYAPPGVYSIFAEPVFGTAVGSKANLSNIRLRRTTISLPPVAVPVSRTRNSEIKVATRQIYSPLGVPFYDTDSSLSSNKSLRLLDNRYSETQDYTVNLSNVNDISLDFRPSHIDFSLNARSLVNHTDLSRAQSKPYSNYHSTGTLRAIDQRQKTHDSNYQNILEGRSHYNLNNLKPSFRFAIQKSYVGGQTGQGCHLIGLFGPNPFLLYDLSLSKIDANRGPYINILGQFTGRPRTPTGRINDFPVLEDTVLFYYKLELAADSFTNFYYYDESDDTLYLQIAQGLQTRYVSVKNLLKGFRHSDFTARDLRNSAGDLIGTPEYPYVMQFPPTLVHKQSGYEYYVRAGTVNNRQPNNSAVYRSIIRKILPNDFVVKDKAQVPTALQASLSEDPRNNISGFQETNPDNGVYINTTNSADFNFYRVSTNTEQQVTSIIPYPSSDALSIQQWQSVNLPTSVKVLYEDSGFYLTKRTSTARTPTGIAVPAPVILSASKNDGVGTYQGFSTINIEAKFTGSLNLDIYEFRGYVVEKYVDSNWVQIETSSVYTEYDPQDRFQSNFSFKIFLADGVARYRMAVKLRGVTDDVEIIGSYVELEKLTENLITEDFD